MGGGSDAYKISELDWHDSEDYEDVEFTLTSAQNFSGGALGKINSQLWRSWIISSEKVKVYFSGDGGYSETFRGLGDRYGPFDIAFVEGSAYTADWSEVHMFPNKPVQASIDLKANVLFPIHWSEFNLSIHPWDEPIIHITKEAGRRNVNITTSMIDEVFDLTNLPNNP